jgi:uncharacterized protein YecE (DUF72 family)
MKVEIDAPYVDVIQARALRAWVNHWAESISYVGKVYVVVTGTHDHYHRKVKDNTAEFSQSVLNKFRR